jgi:CheY-specific phosphatase CheX
MEDAVDYEEIHIFLEEFANLDSKVRRDVNEIFTMLAGKTVEELQRDIDTEDDGDEAHDVVWEDVEPWD